MNQLWGYIQSVVTLIEGFNFFPGICFVYLFIFHYRTTWNQSKLKAQAELSVLDNLDLKLQANVLRYNPILTVLCELIW